MADWLRLPSGQGINMERIVTITRPAHSAPGAPAHVSLRSADGQIIELLGPDAEALQRYLDGHAWARERL